jgi:tRNA modification GTPase
VHLDGLPLNLIDTAGLRTAQDMAEAEGIRRATHEMGRADRVLYVVDAANPTEAAFSALAPQLATLPPGVPVTIVFNKIDLVAIPSRLDETTTPAQLYLSARTGAGIDLLRSHLKKSAGFLDSGSGALSARRRHLDALRRSRDHALKAADTLLESRSPELFAEDLRLAQRALGEITGEFGSDDLLGEIFGSFCIGK